MPVMETIRFGQMLDMMDRFDSEGNPVPFSIVFVTANKQRQTGGELHIYGKPTPWIKKLRARIPDAVYTDSNVIKCVGKRDGKTVIDARPKGSPKQGKNPNHYKNSTRNIMILSSGAIRKVHIRLILYFNEKKVIP